MWIYASYCWPSQADYIAALVAEGWQDGAPNGVDLLVSGLVYSPATGSETSSEPLPGWHVAAAFRSPVVPPLSWAELVLPVSPEGMAVLGRNPRVITALAFYSRFTQAERISMRAVAVFNDAEVFALAQGQVNLDSEEAQRLLQAAVSFGVLSLERSNQILG